MADQKRGSESSSPDEGLEETTAIPLLEERLSIAKQRIESGRVRVHVTVDKRDEIVSEQLLHDELEIQRVPRNVRLTEIPQVRVEGDVTIVPVVEEVAVVEKALVLVEEIHIVRKSVAKMTEIATTLRSERARIEREAGTEPAPVAE